MSTSEFGDEEEEGDRWRVRGRVEAHEDDGLM
jgi:hypothetical protein